MLTAVLWILVSLITLFAFSFVAIRNRETIYAWKDKILKRNDSIWEDAKRVIATLITASLLGIGVSFASGSTWGLITGIAIAVVLFCNTPVILPEQTESIPSLWGRRESRYVGEGLHFTYPGIEAFKEEYRFPSFRRKLNISIEFYSGGEQDNVLDKGQLQLDLEAVLVYRPDLDVEKDGEIVFPEVVGPDMENEDVLVDAITSAIKNELGKFGGLYRYYMFINRRGAITKFINSILRLEAPPHANPKKYLVQKIETLQEQELIDEDEYPNLREQLEEWSGDSLSAEITQDKRIEFYEKFSGPIGALLRSEAEQGSRSPEEETNGVDLIRFEIGDVGFSESAKKALQAEAERVAKLEAADHTQAKRLEYLEELVDAGVDPDEALGSVDASFDEVDASKKTISIPGAENAVCLLMEKVGS